MRVFARTKSNGDYFNINIANAAIGFYEMGFEIIKYYLVKDVYDDYEKGDILLDGILQVKYALQKFELETPDIDYPEILQPYMGRKIWTSKINTVNTHPEMWPLFVKPVDGKKFTGVVVREPKDLIGCGSCYDNAYVICSEIVNFNREWRAFVRYDEILDIRPYKGDWRLQYDEKVIENALKDFSDWKDRPYGCSLDFGVTDKGQTLLVEMNDGYSLGCYGLNSNYYAKLISARISQLSKTKDECKF